MGNVSTIGIDIAKNTFSVCGGNEHGRVIMRKRVYRSDMLRFMQKQPASLVGIEACSGAHYWGRELQKMGHIVKLMPPQYVKPYVKTNKNDANDAEACFEAVQRPTMRFVDIKTEESQSLGQLHRLRERLVCARTAASNEVRGFLYEFGVTIPRGVNKVQAEAAAALSEQGDLIPQLSRVLVEKILEELRRIEEEIEFCNGKIKEFHKESEQSQLLCTIGGIGKITSTAIIAAVPRPQAFKNGRQFAAFLGLTPSQHSTGGKARLGKISKRGDGYIRKLLIQGALAEIMHVGKKTDRRSLWIKELFKRQKKVQKTAVALANKNARIALVLLTRGGTFDRDHAPKIEKKAA